MSFNMLLDSHRGGIIEVTHIHGHQTVKTRIVSQGNKPNSYQGEFYFHMS